MLYYQGYEIAEEYNYLEEEELHVLYACHWMVDNYLPNYIDAWWSRYRKIWKEEESLMGDLIEVKVIKSGFSAMNENLTDIARSLRKLTAKEEERWRTVDVDGYPDPEYEWVLAIVSCNGRIDNIPIVAKYNRKEHCWIVHFPDGYMDQSLNSDCEVVRWLPIFGDSSNILYADGEEFGRVHRYGE